MRNSGSAKALAVLLLLLVPNQGAFPQSMSPTAANDSGSMSLAPSADQAQAPADQSAPPATPAAPAAPVAPPGDQPSPSTPPDQSSVPPAAPADQGGSLPPASSSHQKKMVTAPDSSPAPGSGQGPIVREINVEFIGPHTVAKSVVLSNMRTTVGQVYSAAAVEEDVRNLYATGFFTNLAIKDEPLGDGVRVNVVVEPKPLVKEVIVRGASKIKTTRVRKEIKTKVGETLSEQQISADADKIKDLYLNKGYNQVQVSYKIDTNEEFGRSVVTYVISEGERAYVSEVDFVGNQKLTTKELRKIMKTRRKNLLSFLNKSGIFKEDDFKGDLDNLRTYYNSKGYIDMEVRDVKFEYPKKDQMKVTITVFEGIEYTVGKVNFEGNTVYTEAQLRSYQGYPVIKMDEGKVYSPRPFVPEKKNPEDYQGQATLEGDIKRIRDLYGRKGYIEMDVTPERQANVESGKIDILYHIVENSQSYVEQIVIQGNNRTKDKVIRRELLVAPGQIYDSVRADVSKKRLENLQYFEKVDISPQDTSVPNRKNMVVTVEEKRTGSVTFGAGFSSVDSLLGFVEITQGNFDITNFPYFTGGGEKFRVRLQYGIERQDAEVEFKEPWFLEQRLALGFNLFYHNATYLSDYYNEQNYGASVSLARGFGQFWAGSITYTIQQFDLHDFASNSPPELVREGGWRSDSSITFGLQYDTRDSVLLTRRGVHADASIELAGGPLYGQTNIYKLQMDAQKYILLPYDCILMIGVATGNAEAFGDSTEVPLFDRFFIGGSRSVRGFHNRDVGPVTSETTFDRVARRVNGIPTIVPLLQTYPQEPLGGDTMFYQNTELTFPIMDRVRGAVFNDIGFLDPDAFTYGRIFKNDPYPGANGEIVAAAGIGLRLNLPIGPLRLDYALPYVDQGYNKSNSGRFDFDVGYQF